jgi:hypothetical protein
VEARRPDPAPAQRSASVVVAACAASAGVHAALVPQHLVGEPRLGAAFIAATALLVAVVAALTFRPTRLGVGHAATPMLAALIGAYALNVTAGARWFSDGPEPVDLVGLTTKAVEALGLVFPIRLNLTMGERGSLTHKEARP